MSTLTGTRKLIRLILRRDRWLLPLWLIFVMMPVSFVSSLDGLYPTAAERQEFAADMESNSMLMVLYGRLWGDGLGELVAWRAGFFPVAFGLFAMLLVIRHTRAEEENGRRELIGATVVGRYAGLAAALIVTFLISAVVWVLMALAVAGQGLPAGGSWALGAQFAITGWVFAAVGGVAAQLTTGALAARGLGALVLGGAFLLRGVGDASGQGGGGAGWVSWLSPLGWANQIRAFDGNRWWVLLPTAALVAALAWTAAFLYRRRDIGEGQFAAKPGPETAAPRLNGPFALAWRLHRGSLLGWGAGFAVFGLVYGGVGQTVEETLRDSQGLQDAFARAGGTGALVDSYLASMMGLIGIVAAAYGLAATLRLRSEESGLRAEHVLATSVGRMRWVAGHLFFSFLGPAVLLIVAGLASGIAYGMAAGDVGGQVPRLLGGALVQLPAVWVLAAIGVALVGALPRLAAVSWGALGVCVLLGQVGAVLELSQGVLDISPFTHIPKLPGGDMSVVPLLWLVVVAAAIGAAGLMRLRRRDVPVV